MWKESKGGRNTKRERGKEKIEVNKYEYAEERKATEEGKDR